MKEASLWRLALGRQIGMAYAANPKARVVMVAGSTGRGTADRYSDLEIDGYWSEPPTDDERRAAAEASGGTLIDLSPYEEDEWAEEISFGGFLVGTSTFLIETMERYLTEVVEKYSTEPLPHIRLFSLIHAQTVTGEDLVLISPRALKRLSAWHPGRAFSSCTPSVRTPLPSSTSTCRTSIPRNTERISGAAAAFGMALRISSLDYSSTRSIGLQPVGLWKEQGAVSTR